MKFSRTEIDIATMKINGVGSGCTVSFSQSDQRSFYSKVKRTGGFGEENGDHSLHEHTISFIDDDDFADSNTTSETAD